MSTFSAEHSYDFDAYGFTYHHPSASDPNAYIKVTQGSTTIKTFDLMDKVVGLHAADGQIQFGDAGFPEGAELVQLEELVINPPPQFTIVALGSSRIGGIGIEDLRDAGFKRHTFELEFEPISIWFNTGLQKLEVEFRDPATASDEELPWYLYEEVE